VPGRKALSVLSTHLTPLAGLCLALMARENSFSDDDGRFLTPELQDNQADVPPPRSTFKFTADGLPTPRDKFRTVVRKVIAMHRSTQVISGTMTAGAEPGIDPRRESVALQYGSIKVESVIQVIDYSGVTLESRRMGNKEFIELMDRPRRKSSVNGVVHNDERGHWVKVRWINIAGVSWDVMKAVSIKYGT
jgi:hypothetical protein